MLLASGTAPTLSRSEALPAQQLEPAAGRILVSRPHLPDPNFFDSAILLLAHDESGSLGLVFNRRSEVKVSEAAPSSEILSQRQDALYFGGPVEIATITVLLRDDSPPADATPILPDVFLLRTSADLEELTATDPPASRLRFFAGYAGWSAGQLEDEISRGTWDLLAGEAGWIFNDEPDETWKKLTRILRGPTA